MLLCGFILVHHNNSFFDVEVKGACQRIGLGTDGLHDEQSLIVLVYNAVTGYDLVIGFIFMDCLDLMKHQPACRIHNGAGKQEDKVKGVHELDMGILMSQAGTT